MFQQYAPPASLAKFVDYFWAYEERLPADWPIIERALPTGRPELIMNLSTSEHHAQVFMRSDLKQGTSLPVSVLLGAQSTWQLLEPARVMVHVGAHFNAGGATPFLPVPASELHNLHVPLHDLWGASALELRERLLEAPTPEARVRLLAQALLAHASQPLARHPAVAFALRTYHVAPHWHTIAEVADQIGISQRHFRALFRAEVGLSPKQYCRVHRLMNALQRIRKGAQVAWADLAVACGYYDQAHLANEFHALAGLSPTAYVRDRHPLLPTYVPLSAGE